jgi:hypothetical protein
MLLAASALIGAATAAEGAGPPKPSLELVGASTGMSKGIAQTEGPQFLARGELPFGRIYFGAYAKNVDSPVSKGEAAALVGIRAASHGFDLNVSAALKRALSPSAASDKNALEVSGSVSRKMGALTPRLSLVWSPDDLGGTRQTTFLEAGASYAMAKKLALSAAVGRRERSGGADYTAWNAGIAWTPGPHLVLDARYYDTDGGDGHAFRARGVVSARLKF